MFTLWVVWIVRCLETRKLSEVGELHADTDVRHRRPDEKTPYPSIYTYNVISRVIVLLWYIYTTIIFHIFCSFHTVHSREDENSLKYSPVCIHLRMEYNYFHPTDQQSRDGRYRQCQRLRYTACNTNIRLISCVDIWCIIICVWNILSMNHKWCGYKSQTVERSHCFSSHKFQVLTLESQVKNPKRVINKLIHTCYFPDKLYEMKMSRNITIKI